MYLINYSIDDIRLLENINIKELF